MSEEMELQKLADNIGLLIQQKNVTIQDDYFYDIFLDKNGKQLFSVKSSRFSDDLFSLMSDIIEKLKSI